MPVKQQLLNHFKYLKQTVNTIGASALLDFDSFHVQVRKNNSILMLYPQFVVYRENNVKRYTHKFDESAVRFCGWRPYVNKAVEIFAYKLELKKALLQKGIQMPAHSTNPADELSDVIIKRQVSSFANTIKGPFRTSNGQPLDPKLGEYFEQFIKGDVLKIWFWNDVPVCLEKQQMPVLMGDGESTILSLITRIVPEKHLNSVLSSARNILSYQNRQLDSVLKKDESIMIDFRYGSKLAPKNAIVDEAIVSDYDPIIKLQLENTGKALWSLLPVKLRDGMVFTVDAILDEQKQLWFLEANANPFVHPYVYQPMLNSYFTLQTAESGNISTVN